MSKRILMTGATDGIGLLTAQNLAAAGHTVLLHGRDETKLSAAADQIAGSTERHLADLSRLSDVAAMADRIRSRWDRLDVLINNAGVLKTPSPKTPEGLDVRFVVNTFAPYLLTKRLLPIIPKSGRVVNLSSAAQAPVDLAALAGERDLDDMTAYAQSKLAITIWTREMARDLADGPVFIALNPGSLLASKMVKEGFGVPGKDLQIGAGVLARAAVDDAFAAASGAYFDNDAERFAQPHAAALDRDHARDVMRAVDAQVEAWI